MHEVTIMIVLNGWIVHVGCQTVVYTVREALLTDLNEYLADPQGKEKEMLGKAINSQIIGSSQVPTPKDKKVGGCAVTESWDAA